MQLIYCEKVNLEESGTFHVHCIFRMGVTMPSFVIVSYTEHCTMFKCMTDNLFPTQIEHMVSQMEAIYNEFKNQ
jgi:hypothetical protein